MSNTEVKPPLVFNFGVEPDDLSLPKVNEKGEPTNPTVTLEDSKVIFENVFSNCTLCVYPKGPKGPKIFVYNKILRKLDKAETPEIELNEQEVNLLKEIFTNEEISVHPRQNRAYAAYMERLEPIFDKVNKMKSS